MITEKAKKEICKFPYAIQVLGLLWFHSPLTVKDLELNKFCMLVSKITGVCVGDIARALVYLRSRDYIKNTHTLYYVNKKDEGTWCLNLMLEMGLELKRLVKLKI